VAENKIVVGFDKVDWVEKFCQLARGVGEVIAEFWYGAKSQTLPWTSCFAIGIVFTVVLLNGWDAPLWGLLDVAQYRPISFPWFQIYATPLVFSGFLGWCLYQVMLKRRLSKRLTHAFTDAELKSRRGKFPTFIFDRPLDTYARKLRLGKAGMSKDKFSQAVPTLESSLHVYVDEVRENRVGGTIDILYSHNEMDECFKLENIHDIPTRKITVGKTRADTLNIDINSVPHILVGGLTGGGKSTFLRQVITSLYVNNSKYRFSLIDLKEGLEFQLFENLPRVDVKKTASDAVGKLELLQSMLEDRLKILGANKCKDIIAFQKMDKDKRSYPDGAPRDVNFDREVIVIDEVAELFLAGGAASAQESKSAREIIGRIARIGRAAGLHLVLGTQRPDKSALDTQIKANLPGKLCFQMSDNASSMVMLGNGRAKDLPGIPGRAIWQHGLNMLEVQTPFLDTDEAAGLLEKYQKSSQQQKQVSHKNSNSTVEQRG